MSAISTAEVVQAIEEAQRRGMEPLVLVLPIAPEYLSDIDRALLRATAEEGAMNAILPMLQHVGPRP